MLIVRRLIVWLLLAAGAAAPASALWIGTATQDSALRDVGMLAAGIAGLLIGRRAAFRRPARPRILRITNRTGG